jgi:hypothetical protein
VIYGYCHLTPCDSQLSQSHNKVIYGYCHLTPCDPSAEPRLPSNHIAPSESLPERTLDPE